MRFATTAKFLRGFAQHNLASARRVLSFRKEICGAARVPNGHFFPPPPRLPRNYGTAVVGVLPIHDGRTYTPMDLGCGYKLGFMREIKCALLSKRRRLYRDRGPRYSLTACVCTYDPSPRANVCVCVYSAQRHSPSNAPSTTIPIRNTHRLTVKFRE